MIRSWLHIYTIHPITIRQKLFRNRLQDQIPIKLYSKSTILTFPNADPSIPFLVFSMDHSGILITPSIGFIFCTINITSQAFPREISCKFEYIFLSHTISWYTLYFRSHLLCICRSFSWMNIIRSFTHLHRKMFVCNELLIQ